MTYIAVALLAFIAGGALTFLYFSPDINIVRPLQ